MERNDDARRTCVPPGVARVKEVGLLRGTAPARPRTPATGTLSTAAGPLSGTLRWPTVISTTRRRRTTVAPIGRANPVARAAGRRLRPVSLTVTGFRPGTRPSRGPLAFTTLGAGRPLAFAIGRTNSFAGFTGRRPRTIPLTAAGAFAAPTGFHGFPGDGALGVTQLSVIVTVESLEDFLAVPLHHVLARRGLFLFADLSVAVAIGPIAHGLGRFAGAFHLLAGQLAVAVGVEPLQQLLANAGRRARGPRSSVRIAFVLREGGACGDNHR